MFPVLGFLLKSHKTVLKNRDELFAFIRMTFLDHQHKFDKNDPRSLIDAFLVRQQEVMVLCSGVTFAYCLLFGLISCIWSKNISCKEERSLNSIKLIMVDMYPTKNAIYYIFHSRIFSTAFPITL